jgi:hypothetical protein
MVAKCEGAIRLLPVHVPELEIEEDDRKVGTQFFPEAEIESYDGEDPGGPVWAESKQPDTVSGSRLPLHQLPDFGPLHFGLANLCQDDR